ncbi:MAG: MFS transporter [Bacteroidales bacterium]|nr:MFS transporter [Bacteroidales bacterium]
MAALKGFRFQGIVVRIIYFLSYAAFSAWLSFFNLFLKDYAGFSDSQIGIIAAIQQINMLLVLPLWGMLADKFGRKNILLLALFIVIILFYGFVLQNSFIAFVVFTFVFTLFYNPLNSLVDSIALDYVEQYKRSSFGELRLWASVGWAMSALLTGYIINAEKSVLIFPIASSILLVNWILIKFIYRPLRFKKNLQSMQISHLKGVLLHNRQLFIVLLILLFYGISSAPIHLFINMYYADIGASFFHVGYAYVFQAMSELPFFFYGKRIVNAIGDQRVILLTMFVTALRMLIYSLVSNPWIAIITGTTHGICLALFFVALVEYVHKFIPPEMRATGQSFIYAFYFGGGMALGNAWIGFLAENIGMKNMMRFESGFTLVMIGLLALIFYIFKNKPLRHYIS